MAENTNYVFIVGTLRGRAAAFARVLNQFYSVYMRLYETELVTEPDGLLKSEKYKI